MRSVSNHKSREEKKNQIQYLQADKKSSSSATSKRRQHRSSQCQERPRQSRLSSRLQMKALSLLVGIIFITYSSKVPFDAIFSEELILRDPTYQLKEADIVSKVKDGHIIKRAGKYYLYLKGCPTYG